MVRQQRQAIGQHARNVNIIKALELDNSGVLHKLLHLTQTDDEQLRIEMKYPQSKVIVERGTLQYIGNQLSISEEPRKIISGGPQYIPTVLQDYGKTVLGGTGEVMLNPIDAETGYILVRSAPKKIRMIIERGVFLACDGDDGNGNGFSVQSSWNPHLVTHVETMRDITTTTIQGKGVYTLQIPYPLEYMTQIEVDGGVKLDENIVVMRTGGLKKVPLPEEQQHIFNKYSGVQGRGFLYQGKGSIWTIPALNLSNKPFNQEIVDIFHKHQAKVDNTDEAETLERASRKPEFLKRLTDNRR